MEAFLGGVIAMFILLLLLFTVGNYVAQYFSVALGVPSYGRTAPIAAWLGIPQDTASWPNALWFIILPMMATLGILYGFFEELRIFRNATNATTIYTVIGIAWSGLLMYTGALKVLALFFFQVGALLAAVVFSVVFIIGVFLWGAFRTKGMYGELKIGSMGGKFEAASGLIKNLEEYEKVLNKYYKKYGNNLENAPDDVKTRIREIETRSANFLNRLDIDLKGQLDKKQRDKIGRLKGWFDSHVSGRLPSLRRS